MSLVGTDDYFGFNTFEADAQITSSQLWSRDGGWFGGPPILDPIPDDMDLFSDAWVLTGDLTGSYVRDAGENGCSFNAVTDPVLDPWSETGEFPNQSFVIYGDEHATTSGSFYVDDMDVHLRGPAGTCDDAPVDYEHSPLPGLDYDSNAANNNPLNLRLPLSGADGPTTTSEGALRWQGTKTLTFHSAELSDTDYSAKWTYDLTYSPDSAGAPCSLAALSPQKPTKGGLAVTVLGNDLGCLATLVTAQVKIEKKGRTVFNRGNPKKHVKPNGLWALKTPYGADLLDKIKNALKKGKGVTAKATFDLDGERASESVRLKLK